MKHDFPSLAALYNYATRVYANRPVAAYADGGQLYTYASIDEKCREISKLLANFGVSVYDKVAIFSQNMPNWIVAFFSTVAFGRIVVPLLTDLSENEISNILTHSDAKALFVSERLLHRVPKEILDRMVVVIRTDDLSIIKAHDEAYTCDGQISDPQGDDIAALIYTSGTSGAAKGVMLSHRNFCANVLEAWVAHKVRRRDVFLSILPLAHAYELSIGMIYPFATGAQVYYIQRPPTPSILVGALRKTRPTCMLSVPLIIEKMYKTSIMPAINKSKFMRWLYNGNEGLACYLVGVKLKKTFGGRLKFFGVGGAKLDSEVEAFLHKAHFPYAIGYGMTECAPLICNASPFKTKVGSTGIAAYGVQIRLDGVNPETGEGEIVCKGDNVMRGYYKDYNRTIQVLKDGWFHTGDLASVDKKGRYSIKGRLGSVILGASGENIYPEEIESVINGISGVNESLVIERDGHLVALVKLDEDVLDWNFEGGDKFISELEARTKAIKEYVNSRVNKNSTITDVEVQKEPFAKTATQKIKRFLYKDRK